MSPPHDVFNPFSRRFTDERAHSFAQTKAFYSRVRTAHHLSRWGKPDAIAKTHTALVDRLAEVIELPTCTPLCEALDTCIHELLDLETQIFEPATVDLSKPLSPKVQVELNRYLRAQEYFLAHQEHVSELLIKAVGDVVGAIIQAIPPLADSAFSVPFISLVPNPTEFVGGLIGIFAEPKLAEAGLCTTLTTQLYENVCAFTGVPSDGSSKKPLRWPSDSELSGQELVDTYLAGTPLQTLLMTKVPFAISIAKRLEHTAIMAGSGWGKTQLLQSIIVKDLERPDPPSIIVIDSTNRMIERLQRLSLFNDRLKDRIVIIDPERSPAPALNMFDINTPRMQGYSSDMRERVETEIIELFNYVFASIENPLSDAMRTALSYVIRLLLTIPDANITTLRNVLEENNKGGYEASKFKPHIDTLDSTARDFFRLQYFTDRVAVTRSSILQRLSSVVRVPAFERMFSTVNKIDFFEKMQAGSCILVNTSEALLKGGSVLFGRYIIARVMAAAFERAPLSDEERRPTFLIVDEAAPYFDDQFEKLLTRVRQFKLGTVIAFQHLEQAPEKLRSAIASNTTVKYAGGLGYADSRWLGREMRTTPEALLALTKDGREPPQFSNFACHVRGMAQPVNLHVPFYTLENMLKMTAQQHAQLLEDNAKSTAHIDPPTSAADQSAPPTAATPSPREQPSPATEALTPESEKPDATEPPNDWADKWG
jgi:hypothetical protein